MGLLGSARVDPSRGTIPPFVAFPNAPRNPEIDRLQQLSREQVSKILMFFRGRGLPPIPPLVPPPLVPMVLEPRPPGVRRRRVRGRNLFGGAGLLRPSPTILAPGGRSGPGRGVVLADTSGRFDGREF